MKIAIITIAGISSRFNEGIEEDKKVLKCLYTEGGKEETLLYHLMKKCSYADHIVLVGGYKFEDLCSFYKSELIEEFPNVSLVLNKHYSDLGSGYSLYLGIQAAIKHNTSEILFVEGDLDIDNASFARVVESEKSVLTYTFEPIYANKAVVLYKDDKDQFRYAFNSNHGLLTIDSAFSCILNSGQTWKFTEVDKLKAANDKFFETAKADTNLRIVQNYLDAGVEIDLVPLNRWTNCNTRDDYRRIVSYWEDEK
jgi:CTP:phosphocholine cytidylyltransferase-like protein